MDIFVDNEEKTKELAHKVAKVVNRGEIIGFVGDLGAGKTTFIRHFINYFYDTEVMVKSPSFTLFNRYEISDDFAINHIDLYRIESYDEFVFSGLEDFVLDENSISLIEWFDRIRDEAEFPFFLIELFFIDENKRKVVVDSKLYQRMGGL